jgi:hypothetical protein
MRIATRFKLRSWFFYATIGRVQVVTGISSKVGPNQHAVFWDFDDSTLDDVINVLHETQLNYMLDEINIFSDKPGSYRAICYTVVTFKELIKILADTPGVDDVFLIKTAQKGQATLRLSPKLGRPKPEIVYTLPGKRDIPPAPFTIWRYETGHDAKVINL